MAALLHRKAELIGNSVLSDSLLSPEAQGQEARSRYGNAFQLDSSSMMMV